MPQFLPVMKKAKAVRITGSRSITFTLVYFSLMKKCCFVTEITAELQFSWKSAQEPTVLSPLSVTPPPRQPQHLGNISEDPQACSVE